MANEAGIGGRQNFFILVRNQDLYNETGIAHGLFEDARKHAVLAENIEPELLLLAGVLRSRKARGLFLDAFEDVGLHLLRNEVAALVRVVECFLDGSPQVKQRQSYND